MKFLLLTVLSTFFLMIQVQAKKVSSSVISDISDALKKTEEFQLVGIDDDCSFESLSGCARNYLLLTLGEDFDEDDVEFSQVEFYVDTNEFPVGTLTKASELGVPDKIIDVVKKQNLELAYFTGSIATEADVHFFSRPSTSSCIIIREKTSSETVYACR